jgi:hypothetical protein
VLAHKNELEKWDTYAWKEFRQSVEKLKDAWTGRKNLVVKAMEGYSAQWNPADAQRVQEVSALFVRSINVA